MFGSRKNKKDPRVSEIRYVGYGVTRLDAERAFYRDVWKLDEVAEQDGMVYFAAAGAPEHHVVRLRPSDEDRIDIIALKAETQDDVRGLFEKVKAADCKIIHEPRDLTGPGGGYGFRFFIRDGLPFEISSGVADRSARKLEPWEGVPEKISHIVLHSPDHKALVDFFVEVLGFKVSDWLGDFMCFLRCNEWHHRIALLPGPPCLNHVAYDMPSIDDMMRGIHRLKEEDVNIQWGPGRHTAGNNTFSYFVSPGGNVVEYTSELERVDDATWEATVHNPSQLVMDQWSINDSGPKDMPEPRPDPGLFKPVEV